MANKGDGDEDLTYDQVVLKGARSCADASEVSLQEDAEAYPSPIADLFHNAHLLLSHEGTVVTLDYERDERESSDLLEHELQQMVMVERRRSGASTVTQWLDAVDEDTRSPQIEVNVRSPSNSPSAKDHSNSKSKKMSFDEGERPTTTQSASAEPAPEPELEQAPAGQSKRSAGEAFLAPFPHSPAAVDRKQQWKSSAPARLKPVSPGLKESKSAPVLAPSELEEQNSELQCMLLHERQQHLAVRAQVAELQRKLKLANAQLKAPPKATRIPKRFGVTEMGPYAAQVCPVSKPSSSPNTSKSRGLFLPPLQPLPASEPCVDKAGTVAAAAMELVRPERLAMQSRSERSKSRLEAITQLDSVGACTWDVRMDEKIQRLQDLSSLSHTVWDKFKDWRATLELKSKT